jgi:hypothetical protein
MFVSGLLITRMLPIRVTYRILNLVIRKIRVLFRGKVIKRNRILQSDIIEFVHLNS